MKDTRQELKDYAIEYDYRNYRLVWKGKSWAVMKSISCYNKNSKHWELEPSPSNRDDIFLQDCRFSLIEGKEIIEQLTKLSKDVGQ